MHSTLYEGKIMNDNATAPVFILLNVAAHVVAKHTDLNYYIYYAGVPTAYTYSMHVHTIFTTVIIIMIY